MQTVNCKNRQGDERNVPIEELVFRVSVYGVLIKDNAVLLVPQWTDGYDLPGGGVELGETLDMAFVREFKEETGLTVSRGKLIHCADDFWITPFTKQPFHCVLLYFVAEYESGIVSDAGFDEDEKRYAKKAEWISLDKVGSLKFYNPVDSVAIIHGIAKLSK
jgi:ADP-ribose pyrophosphatase YjhB (NUDIX family)